MYDCTIVRCASSENDHTSTQCRTVVEQLQFSAAPLFKSDTECRDTGRKQCYRIILNMHFGAVAAAAHTHRKH